MSVKPTIVELILNATVAGKSMLSAANAAAQKTLLSLVKGDVGLGNVDNTSDASKPVSTAQQTALDAKLALAGGTMTGDLKFVDASYDIGKSGATRPRDGFFSRNVSIGGTLGVTGATTVVDMTTSGSIMLGGNITINNGAYNYQYLATGKAIFLFNSSGNYGKIQNDSGGKFSLAWAASGGTGLGTPVVTWVDTGRCGINNASPSVALDVTGAINATGLMCCGVYTFATVPIASSNTGKFLRISDRTQKHAYSDGTNWRFFGDDAIIS